MSSSEQAPEPTMDEILASIRKIISDDEAEESSQPEAANTDMPAQAGDGFANDLAEALGDSQPRGQEGADDILDLTQAVDQDIPGGSPHGDPLQSTLAQAGGDMQAPPAPAEPGPPPSEPAPGPSGTPSAQSAGEPDIAAILAEAGVQDTSDETSAPAPAQEDASMAEGPAGMGDPAAGPAQQAVARALNSGSEPAPAPQAPPAPEPPAPAASLDMGAPAPEEPAQAPLPPETPPAPGATGMPDAPEETMVPPADMPGDAPQPAGLDPMGEAPVQDMPGPAAAPETPLADTAGPETAEEVEAAAAAVADEGAAGPEKSLEDSVKDMLRPMLREWLDENMERIVHDAVKDEFAAGNVKGNGSQ